MAAITYATSWVNVCNRALSRLGAESITTMEEGTDRSILCLLHLPEAVETLIQGNDWNCLKKDVELVQSDKTLDYEYDYQYALPADYGRIIEVYPRGYKYSVVEDYLLTDLDEEVYLTYIYKPTADPTTIPGTLLNAITMELAATLALPLTSNASLTERLERKAAAARVVAINQDNRANDADEVAGYRGVDYSEERR